MESIKVSYLNYRHQGAYLKVHNRDKKVLWVISDIINFTSFYTNAQKQRLFLKSVKKEMKDNKGKPSAFFKWSKN